MATPADVMSASDAPRLAVVCSSPKGRARLDAIATELLSRMEPDLAARLARSCLVFALDGEQHAAFAQGLGGAHDATGALAAERVRQRARPDEPLTLIVLTLTARHRQDVAWTLGHELGHVACGHTATNRPAAASLTDDELAAIEREADDFAARYAR